MTGARVPDARAVAVDAAESALTFHPSRRRGSAPTNDFVTRHPHGGKFGIFHVGDTGIGGTDSLLRSSSALCDGANEFRLETRRLNCLRRSPMRPTKTREHCVHTMCVSARRRMNEAWLEELDLETCLRLLAESSVGRIAVVADDFPIVLPVNYRLVESSEANWLAVRTRPGSVLDRAHVPVAFEIDAIDPGHHQGWSVLVRGHLQHVDPDAADSHAVRS